MRAAFLPGKLMHFLLLLGCCTTWVPSSARAETFTVVADAWEGYTEADGSGLWFDMMRLIYEPLGHHVQPRVVPYTRALDEITRGKADITPAVYQGDIDDRFVEFSIVIEQDSVDAFIIDSRFEDWQGLQSLEGKVVVARLGYGYGRFLPKGVHYSEKPSLRGMLQMLELGRADAVLDYERDVATLAKDTGIKPTWTIKSAVIMPAQHTAFAQTPAGQKARGIFRQRMAELLGNGGLVPLLQKHGVEPRYYPKLNPAKP